MGRQGDGSFWNGPWDSSVSGGLYQVLLSAFSPEPLPQEEDKLPQRNANPGIKVCSRPIPILQAGAPLCVGEPLCQVLEGHLWSQYSSPGPELGALQVSAQTPVCRLEALQFLTQPAQRPDRELFQAWLRCFFVLAGVSSETITPPINYLLFGELLSLSSEHPSTHHGLSQGLLSSQQSPLCAVLGAPPVVAQTLYLPPPLVCLAVFRCTLPRLGGDD